MVLPETQDRSRHLEGRVVVFVVVALSCGKVWTGEVFNRRFFFCWLVYFFPEFVREPLEQVTRYSVCVCFCFGLFFCTVFCPAETVADRIGVNNKAKKKSGALSSGNVRTV